MSGVLVGHTGPPDSTTLPCLPDHLPVQQGPDMVSQLTQHSIHSRHHQLAFVTVMKPRVILKVYTTNLLTTKHPQIVMWYYYQLLVK